MVVDARGVPSRYIRVEGCFAIEQLAHARHQRHVPVRHLDSPRGAAVRAVTATRHAGGIDGDAVVHRGLQRSTVGKRAPGVDTECGIISRGSGPAAGAGRAHSVLDAFVLQARVEDPRARWTVRRESNPSVRDFTASQVSAPVNIPVVFAFSAKVHP